MPAVARSYYTTGVALVGAGFVAAAQLVPPMHQAQTRVIEAAVNLAAAVSNGQACSGYNTQGCDIWTQPSYTPVAVDPSGSASNIPANLANAVLSMPAAWLDGMNDFSYALEVTGNWWVYSPTNVLGFDPADPPKITAMTNWSIPFKALSNPLGDQLAWWSRANLPMDPSCTGTVGPACHDIAPILSKMFLAPAWTLAAGYQFPTLFNPVSDAEGAIGEEIPGSTGAEAPWSGVYVKLDPNDPINSVINYLQSDPVLNSPKSITMDQVAASLDRFTKAMVLAFNPIVPMSYLLKGWPYTALTPLFLPFVPLVCPQCDPENPGGPPRTPSSAAAAAPAATTLVDDISAEPSPAAPVSTPAEPASNTAEPGSAAEPVSAATGEPRESATPAAAADAGTAEATAPAPDPVPAESGAAADTTSADAVVADAAQETATSAGPTAAAADSAEPAPAAETVGPRHRLAMSRSGASNSRGTEQGGSGAGRSAGSAD
jgi:hypothetical protein